MNKQTIIKTLRYFRMLNLADRIYFLKIKRISSEDNRRFFKENSDVSIPPDEMLFEILGNNSHRGYWESGITDSKWIIDIIKKKKANEKLQIAEWGCGPARVIRHIKDTKKNYTCYGFDYDEEFIEWCQNNMHDCTFLKNDLNPPLNLASDTLDVFYCVSVFTHLSENMHIEWIKEIWRVLKPGGLFIGTFHGEKFRNRLLPDEIKIFDTSGLVIRGMVREGSKNYSAYQSSTFLRENLLRDFVDVSEIEGAPFHQNVWCGVKPRLAP
jgi:SAM-dependent methyltransferase